MDLTPSLIEGLILLAVAGLGGWLLRIELKVANMHQKLVETQLDLARNYHTKGELRTTIEDAIKPLAVQIERLVRAIEGGN